MVSVPLENGVSILFRIVILLFTFFKDVVAPIAGLAKKFLPMSALKSESLSLPLVTLFPSGVCPPRNTKYNSPVHVDYES
jgi:hypothetical protein